MKKKDFSLFFYTLLALIIFIQSGCNFPHPTGLLTPEIEVLPGKIVRVGEEVFFNAAGSDTSSYIYTYNTLKWKFGDEDQLPIQPDDRFFGQAGISMSHFYNQPGKYTVTLTIRGPYSDGNIDPDSITLNNGQNPDGALAPDRTFGRATVDIEVIGTPRNGKLELLHADFHTRLAQYIYARAAAAALEAAWVRVDITGSSGYRDTLCSSALRAGGEVKFLLRNASLQSGDYTLTAKLYSGSNEVIDTVTEYFPKPYNGVPRVGINEDNAICIGGVPFYPVGFFMLNGTNFGSWANKYVNCAYAEGWYNYINHQGEPAPRPPEVNESGDHNPVTWSNYLDLAQVSGMYVIGPERWVGKGVINATDRNSNPNRIKEYVERAKDKPALMAWTWDDEPNMGGTEGIISSPIVRSWTFITHRIDPQHPVAINYSGTNYLPSPNYAPGTFAYAGASHYDYMFDAVYFGGRKTLPADIIGFDIYPHEFQNHLGFISTAQVFESYIMAVELLDEKNYRLAPMLNYVEIADIGERLDGAPGPTAPQLKMHTWINVVHNVKAISWFPSTRGIDTPDANYVVMEEFVKQITALAGVVLAPDPGITVTDNADTRGNRVDTMIRKYKNETWIFAVRVTELPEAGGAITVTFNVGTSLPSTAEVYDESRTITATGNSFTDSFDLNAVHIYRFR